MLEKVDEIVGVTKKCRVCNEEKLLKEFHVDKKAKYGVRTICKICANENSKRIRGEDAERISKQRKEHYELNKERILEERKEYYEENRETVKERVLRYYQDNKEVVLQKSKKYQEEHKEEMKTYRREHRLENIEEYKARDKKYSEENKDRIRAYRQSLKGKWVAYRTTAKRRNRPFELTLEQFASFWQQPCHYCGCDVPTICLDRVDSSKGYIFENVVSSCLNHNRMKLDHTTEEFIQLCRDVVNFHDKKSP
jgi:hypothetical protein